MTSPKTSVRRKSRLCFLTEDFRVPRLGSFLKQQFQNLHQQWLDDIAKHICEAEVTTLVTVGQLGMSNAEKVEQCRIEVMDADGVFRDVVAVVIRGAIRGSALDTRAKHKHRETPWVVIAAILIDR